MNIIKENLTIFLVAGGIVLALVTGTVIFLNREGESVLSQVRIWNSKKSTAPEKKTAAQSKSLNVKAETIKAEPESSEAEPESSTLFAEATESSQLAILSRAMMSSNLENDIKKDAPVTFFVFNDEAYSKLSKAEQEEFLQKENSDKLARKIRYHIIPGAFMINDFYDGENIRTLSGDIITITKKDDTYTINGKSNVIKTNIKLKHGVLHIIDGVLIPPVDKDK